MEGGCERATRIELVSLVVDVGGCSHFRGVASVASCERSEPATPTVVAPNSVRLLLDSLTARFAYCTLRLLLASLAARFACCSLRSLACLLVFLKARSLRSAHSPVLRHQVFECWVVQNAVGKSSRKGLLL